MATSPNRPLSPHLGVYRWGPHMTVSILHRVTGAGLSLVGLAVLTWWLVALSGGADSYAAFTKAANGGGYLSASATSSGDVLGFASLDQARHGFQFGSFDVA